MTQQTGEKLRKVLFNEVSLITGIVAVVLSGFIYLTNPHATTDVALRLQEERIVAQRATIDNLTKVQQNDTQEIKAELKELNQEIEEVCISIKELSTIINERIPAKK